MKAQVIKFPPNRIKRTAGSGDQFLLVAVASACVGAVLGALIVGCFR